MRKNGRPANDRLRAMRFALWAQRHDPRELTALAISGLLDVGLGTARLWRQDYLTAISAVEIQGIPPVLTPRPEAHQTAPAATGPASPSTRS